MHRVGTNGRRAQPHGAQSTAWRLAVSAYLAAGAFLVEPAPAHERPLLQPAQAPGHNPLDCYCRAQGRIYAPGETICLRVGGRGQLAECRMEVNVMSWTPTERPCPES
jgi:hypothetical protein